MADVALMKEKARVIRRHILEMTAHAKSGHASSSLSAVEILVSLYFDELNIDPAQPRWPERDRFLMSKGHASPVVYATMAERGFLPVDELKTFRKIDSRLQGHPTVHKLPGIEIASGSLGQGLSQGVGMAVGARLDGESWRTYVLLGDGELHEGQNWEAALAAAHFKLDNLCAIVDYNNRLTDGTLDEILGLAPLDEKFRSFGWHVITVDGHDLGALLAAYAEARETKGKPTVIIARTIKGKGVSFMEDVQGWHGVPPKPEDLERALAELAGGEG